MYGIYIFMFAVLLVIILLLNNGKGNGSLDNVGRVGNFEQYNNVATLIPENNSCLKLLYEKGWLSSSDTSHASNARKDVAADMEVARVPMALNNSVIYPDVNACVLGSERARIYRGLNADNCVMRDVTAAGNAVYHQLTPVSNSSFVTPKGCMASLDDKAGFMQFLDSAYQMKNYDSIKAQIDSNSAIVGLTNQNVALQNQYSQAVDTAKLYKQQLDQLKGQMGATGVDRVESTCKNRFTDWNNVGDWSYNFLDRHDVKCGPGERLTQFQLQTGRTPAQARYQYTCCALDSTPVKGKVGEKVEPRATAFKDTMNWNTISLANHNVVCPGDSVIKGFKLDSKYNGPMTSHARLSYSCGHYNVNALPGKRIQMQCRNATSMADTSGPRFDVLDSHNIKCEDDEALKAYALKSDGANFYYEYTCCKPTLV